MKRLVASIASLVVGASAFAGAASAQEPTEPAAPAANILITTADGREVRSSGGVPADGGGGTVNLGDITIGPGTTIISPAPPPTPTPAPAPPPVEAPPSVAPPVEAPPPAVAPPAPVAGDADGDNLPDDAEAAQGTDPNNPDTDGDFLADGDEINLYGTAPLVFDTDGDGVGDGAEIFGPSPSDPLVADAPAPAPTAPAAPASTPSPTPAAPVVAPQPVPATPVPTPAPTAESEPVFEDEDGDNLPDAAEATYGTDPDNPDTDGDGLADGDEINLYGTNPLNADTDGDGRSDGAELFGPIRGNPRVADAGVPAPTVGAA